MRVFVDTSAFLAYLNRDDRFYPDADRLLRRLIDESDELLTTNYVLIETIVLLQRRIGIEAVSAFKDGIEPLLKVVWIDTTLHEAGLNAMFMANRRQLSLVDCVSFTVCRQLGIKSVFTFDDHFREYGFSILS